MSGVRPSCTKSYANGFTDNTRWDTFQPRDGDIIICTPSKSGTTWMQAICAHLVFKETAFYAPIGTISPWLDIIGTDIEAVLQQLGVQTHRRFIKTHTPLDGLPYFDNVTYVHVARNPLDVMFSMINHMGNMVKDLPGEAELDDLDATLKRWLGTSVEQWAKVGGLSLGYLLHNTKSFWDFRDLPNIHMFHYTTMRADLPGQMKRLADVLGEDIPEELWPELIEGVSLKNMKAKADVFAPGASDGTWKDNARFFDKGRQGEGAQRLSNDQMALYTAELDHFDNKKFKAWMERGEY